jgi:CBS-domain-containing membrane protein
MLKAKDIMTRDVITVKKTTTLGELAGIITQHNISGTPVVDDKGNLQGIVTENDLISQNRRLHIPTILRLFDAFIPLGTSKLENEIKRISASTVEDIFTKEVVTVDEETPVDTVATIMAEKNMHLLPVVTKGEIVGIIGKKDIIKGISNEASE